MKKIKIVNEFQNINTNHIDYVLKKLFIMAIILIPFDNLPYLENVLGELGVRGTVYLFIPIIILTIVNLIINREIFIPKGKYKYSFLLFLTWIIICILVNVPNIINNSFKGRTGSEKLILQVLVVAFMISISYCSIYIIERNNINKENLRNYIALSLIPVGIYSFFELFNIFNIIDFSGIIEKLSYLIHTYYRGEVYPKGIRSVTGEASYFAMYASFAFPFIFSYIFTEKNLNKRLMWIAINLYFMILIIFTKSRTAYAIIFIELFLFFIFILTSKVEPIKKKICIFLMVGLGIAFMFLNKTIIPMYAGDNNSVSKISVVSLYESIKDRNNMSNVARIGMQRAALNIGKDNAVFGVGLGQYGFFVNEYVDEVAMTSDEVQRWINPDNDKKYWPPVFSLYHRIIAEEGFIGFFIWIIIIIYGLYRLIKKIYTNTDDVLSIVFTVSYVGVFICSYNADTFAIIQMWLCFAFLQKQL